MADSRFTMDLPESPHVRVVTDMVDGDPVACQVHIAGLLHFDGVTRAERDAVRAELALLRERVEALAAHWEGWKSPFQPPLTPVLAADDLRAALTTGSDRG